MSLAKLQVWHSWIYFRQCLIRLYSSFSQRFRRYRFSDRISGGYRMNRSFDLHRDLSGGGLSGLGAGATCILSFRLFRVRSPRRLMVSQNFSSRAITSGSRQLYSKVTISKFGVTIIRAGSVATRSGNFRASRQTWAEVTESRRP